MSKITHGVSPKIPRKTTHKTAKRLAISLAAKAARMLKSPRRK